MDSAGRPDGATETELVCAVFIAEGLAVAEFAVAESVAESVDFEPIEAEPSGEFVAAGDGAPVATAAAVGDDVATGVTTVATTGTGASATTTVREGSAATATGVGIGSTVDAADAGTGDADRCAAPFVVAGGTTDAIGSAAGSSSSAGRR